MKLKDVTIGGRYRARVSGAMTTVRVLDLKESSTFGGGYRTTIVAVNESTKRQIMIRSAHDAIATRLECSTIETALSIFRWHRTEGCLVNSLGPG